MLWRKNRWLLRLKENKNSKLGNTVDADCVVARGLSCESLECVEYVSGKGLLWARFLVLPNPAGRRLDGWFKFRSLVLL